MKKKEILVFNPCLPCLNPNKRTKRKPLQKKLLRYNPSLVEGWYWFLREENSSNPKIYYVSKKARLLDNDGNEYISRNIYHFTGTQNLRITFSKAKFDAMEQLLTNGMIEPIKSPKIIDYLESYGFDSFPHGWEI